MQELAVVSPRHVLCIYSPMCHLLVIDKNLAIVSRICNTRTRPVFGIYKICTFEGLLLVILYCSTLCKLRVELIPLRVCYDEIYIRSCQHPFSERIRYCLWQSATVWSPRQDSLYTLCWLMFLNGDEVSKSLKRVNCCCLHREDRLTRILYKLIYYCLSIVILPVCQTSKRADAYNIAVASHHRNCFQQMLRLVAIHDDATFCLQLPGSGIDIKDNYIHTQIHCSLLCRKAGTKGVIEKHHQQCLILAKLLKSITIFLY